MTQSIIDALKKVAELRCDSDDEDFSPFDIVDGPDHAYEAGIDEGRVQLAREILDNAGIEYRKH